MPTLNIEITENGALWGDEDYMDADTELLFDIRDAVDAHLTANMPEGVNWSMNLDDVFHDVEVDKSVSIPSFTFKKGKKTYVIEFEMAENNNNNNNNNNGNLTGGKRRNTRKRSNTCKSRRSTRRRSTRRRYSRK